MAAVCGVSPWGDGVCFCKPLAGHCVCRLVAHSLVLCVLLFKTTVGNTLFTGNVGLRPAARQPTPARSLPHVCCPRKARHSLLADRDTGQHLSTTPGPCHTGPGM